MKRNKRISIIILTIILLNLLLPVVKASEQDSTIESSESQNNFEQENIQQDENELETETSQTQEENELQTEDSKKEEEEIPKEEIPEEVQKEEIPEEVPEEIEEEEIPEESTSFMSLAKGHQVIQNGIYTIKTALNTKKVLDVTGGKLSNGTNIQIWDKAEVDQQKFIVTYLGDGNYRIESLHARKSLDVQGASQNNGANVQQYEGNDTDAQKWILKELGGGFYNIISKCNHLYLDVESGKTSNGTNIQMYEGNGSLAQQFIFESANSQALEDGIYEIQTAIDPSKVLDITSGSYNNFANVQIWEQSNVYQQKFNLTYSEDGYYTITAYHSDKVLDVAGAGTENGTNIQQYEGNGSDAQKWMLRYMGNGYYSVVSKCNGLYMDLDGAKTRNGTNIQMYEGNGSKAQLFLFKKVEKPSKFLEEGMYKIKSAIDNSKVLTVSGGSKVNFANIELDEDQDSRYQKFHISYLGKGCYSIRAVHSKGSLDVAGGGMANGANVQQYDYNGTYAQQWILKDAGGGKYSILSKCNFLAMDIPGGITTNGTNIQMYEENGSLAQQFIFESTNAQALEDGIYEIQTAIDPSKVLDVTSGSYNNFANVQIWERGDVNQQKFKVTYVSNSYYTIEAVHSSKSLDVAGAGTVNGTNIQQYQANGSEAQKWLIKDLGNGYYNIISKCNGLYVDIDGGKTKNGTNVHMYTKNGSMAQSFCFIETTAYGTSNFSNIDEVRYPGYKALLEKLQKAHPNWAITLYYTGLDWNTVVQEEDKIIGGSPKSLIHEYYYNTEGTEWINGDTKYDVSGEWYRASTKAIAYMMDPRARLDEALVFQFQDLSSASGSKSEIARMVSGTFLNTDSIINTIISTARDKEISPFHIVSRIIQEQGADGKGIMNGYDYLRKKSV